MIDVLTFIFASPWRFAGTVVLILALGWALTPLVTIKHVRVDEE